MTNRSWARIPITAFCFGVLPIASVVSAAQEAPVWQWFATCGGPAMALEVHVESAIVLRITFPTCRAQRGGREAQGQGSTIQLLFRSQHAIRWVGYRDVPDTTRPNQPLEMRLWQAGADADDMVIGVSVSNNRTIYMNTIHIAALGARRQSDIAHGVTVITYPLAVKE